MKYVMMAWFGCMTIVLQAQTGQEEIALFSAERVMKYRAKIDLTDEQAAAVKKLYNEHTVSFNTLKWDLDEANLELSDLLSEIKVDSDAAMAQMEKVLALESQMKQKRLAVFLSVKNLLTAEQQEGLSEYATDESVFLTNPSIDLKVRTKSGSGDEPLYIVHEKGEVQEMEKIHHIDPKTIESIEVVKGERAIQKFGEKGKKGVVIIRIKE